MVKKLILVIVAILLICGKCFAFGEVVAITDATASDDYCAFDEWYRMLISGDRDALYNLVHNSEQSYHYHTILKGTEAVCVDMCGEGLRIHVTGESKLYWVLAGNFKNNEAAHPTYYPVHYDNYQQ